MRHTFYAFVLNVGLNVADWKSGPSGTRKPTVLCATFCDDGVAHICTHCTKYAPRGKFRGIMRTKLKIT